MEAQTLTQHVMQNAVATDLVTAQTQTTALLSCLNQILSLVTTLVQPASDTLRLSGTFYLTKIIQDIVL